MNGCALEVGGRIPTRDISLGVTRMRLYRVTFFPPATPKLRSVSLMSAVRLRAHSRRQQALGPRVAGPFDSRSRARPEMRRPARNPRRPRYFQFSPELAGFRRPSCQTETAQRFPAILPLRVPLDNGSPPRFSGERAACVAEARRLFYPSGRITVPQLRGPLARRMSA